MKIRSRSYLRMLHLVARNFKEPLMVSRKVARKKWRSYEEERVKSRLKCSLPVPCTS